MLGAINTAAPRAPQIFSTTPITAPPDNSGSGDVLTLSGHDWRNDIIYFPLTDRFYDGDKSNDANVNPNDIGAFHGGDLQGIIDKLDYIKSTGATTIWLSPLQANTQDVTFGDYHGHGYHGYWINDHDAVEQHQGTLDTAKRLVQEAHAKGLKVVLDTVLNQTGPDHPFANDPSKADMFNHYGDIKDYNDQWWVENGNLAGLPDWNQSNPKTYQYLLDNTAKWVSELNADGVRLDAVKHVPKDFWARFIPDLKEKLHKPDLFVLGEVLNGDPNYLAPYQALGVDHLFDMPLYYTMNDVFGRDASARKLGDRFAEDSKYPDANKLVTLIDNHDFPRFMSYAQGSFDERVKRLELALTMLLTARGTPSVYYGDETAMEGGNDPDNRRDMDFDRRPDVQGFFHKLTGIRASNDALRVGKQLEMWQDDQVYAFSRLTDHSEAIAIFNNSAGDSQRSIPLRQESHLPDGTRLQDQLSGNVYTVKNHQIDITLPGRTPAVLFPC